MKMYYVADSIGKTSAYHPQSNGLTEQFNQTLVIKTAKFRVE